MSYTDTTKKLAAYRQEIAALREKMRTLQASVEPERVQDYELATSDGRVRLSNLFADKADLFVVHNMGTSCPYCTLWADGFNGIYDHLANRAAFVVSSPDTPVVQQRFAAARSWRFPMVSHAGSTFAADMGYRSERGWMPGISVFKKNGDGVVRVSDSSLHPGDDFCALWHILDLLPEGPADWQPQFKYAR
jgi:predicted dithiol-disulfide oxidoreductase (DUF899 family)